MIAFIQPFGLQAPGGGSRILRGLLQCEHPRMMSLCTAIAPPPRSVGDEEVHLPQRPSLGRLETTRFHTYLGVFDRVFRAGFEDRLRTLLKAHSATLLHLIPHGYEIVPALRVANELQIPYFLTVHDDIEYTSLGHPQMKQMLLATSNAWREAQGVFVICDAIGREYSARYGERPFTAVTDGLTVIADAPQIRPGKSLRVYFMGLFHIRYGANLRALLDAMKLIRKAYPDWNLTVTCRCDSVHYDSMKDDIPLTVLPFAPEQEVARDMEAADLLYQPLPFQQDSTAFGRFSLSTKLVTYLGSGLPILYHGPENTAASSLLADRHAAVLCTTLDPETIAAQLIKATFDRDNIVQNALQLARSQFLLADQQRRFWTPIANALSN